MNNKEENIPDPLIESIVFYVMTPSFIVSNIIYVIYKYRRYIIRCKSFKLDL